MQNGTIPKVIVVTLSPLAKLVQTNFANSRKSHPQYVRVYIMAVVLHTNSLLPWPFSNVRFKLQKPDFNHSSVTALFRWFVIFNSFLCAFNASFILIVLLFPTDCSKCFSRNFSFIETVFLCIFTKENIVLWQRRTKNAHILWVTNVTHISL